MHPRPVEELEEEYMTSERSSYTSTSFSANPK